MTSSIAWSDDKNKESLYDEQADGQKLLDAASARAKREYKKVLVVWGGNNCGWCKLLHDFFAKDKATAKLIRDRFVPVWIDVQTKDHNKDLIAKYQPAFPKHGIPYLSVLEHTGKLVTHQETEVFELPKEKRAGKNALAYDSNKLTTFLERFETKLPPAEETLNEALAEAKKSGKRIFLHFGAPWCGWCHRLEAWLAEPEVEKIWSKEFVDVKIDTDLQVGGKELLAKYCKEESGIPWFAIVNAEGKALAHSGFGNKNLGFPYAPDELDGFAKLLKENCQTISAEEQASLMKSLKAAGERVKR